MKYLYKYFYCFAFAIGIHIPLTAQIEFNNNFEKAILTHTDEADEIDFLLAIGDEMDQQNANNLKQSLQSFIDGLDSKKIKSRKREKGIKYVSEKIEDHYLGEFSANADFHELLAKKLFNQVTASAIYALVLSKFEIPYEIKEKENAIYLIAYPSDDRIQLIKSVPGSSQQITDANQKKGEVEILLQLEYISQKDLSNGDFTKAYDNFYYPPKKLTIKELAGIQYFNKALVSSRNSDFHMSLNTIRKCQVLYPHQRNVFVEQLLLTQLLATFNFNSTYSDYLIQYAKHPNALDAYLQSVYQVMLDDKLTKEGDISYIDTVYASLKKHIKDPIILGSINEAHNFAFSSFYHQKSKFKKSIEYAANAYAYNKNNTTYQALIVEGLIRSFYNNAGTVKKMKEMDSYIDRFPFLIENPIFQQLRFQNYAIIAYSYFTANDEQVGLEYLGYMEAIADQAIEDEEININENQFGYIYAEAGALYYRKKQLLRKV